MAVILRFFKGSISHREIYNFTLEHVVNLSDEINKIADLETRKKEEPKLGASQLASFLRNKQEKMKDAKTR